MAKSNTIIQQYTTTEKEILYPFTSYPITPRSRHVIVMMVGVFII
jgi:hypothetical protein